MYGNNVPYLITQYGGPRGLNVRISEEEWESMKSILVDNNGWVKDEHRWPHPAALNDGDKPRLEK